jgi:hypothetical protein
MLFAYDNHLRRNGKKERKTDLSVHNTPVSIYHYLANAIQWCLLIDLSIISRWKETRPHSTKSIMGHLGTRTVNLKCREVHMFANGGLMAGLESLGFDPKRFATLTGVVKTTVQSDLFNEYPVQFPITAVLPLEEVLSAQRLLSRRGFHLKRAVR